MLLAINLNGFLILNKTNGKLICWFDCKFRITQWTQTLRSEFKHKLQKV